MMSPINIRIVKSAKSDLLFLLISVMVYVRKKTNMLLQELSQNKKDYWRGYYKKKEKIAINARVS